MIHYALLLTAAACGVALGWILGSARYFALRRHVQQATIELRETARWAREM